MSRGVLQEKVTIHSSPGADGTVEPNSQLVPQSAEWVRKDFKIPVDHLDMQEFYPHRHCTPYVAWRSILNPEKYYINYKPKAMLLYGADSFTNNVKADEAIAAFKTFPFIASISYHMDEPTQFPISYCLESAHMERLNYSELLACGPTAGKRGLKGLNFRQPVVTLV